MNAPRDGMVFTKNASEAINLVAWAWGVRELAAGDEILVTEMEHHSNIVPWQIVAEITGATRALRAGHARRASSTWRRSGRCCPSAPGWSPSSTRATCSARSTRSPRSPHLAHEQGALVLVDGSQSVPHMPVDVTALGCDFLAFTGHKMLGPTGIGVLVGRPALLEAMEPVPRRRRDDLQRHDARARPGTTCPWKFEAGTPPIAEAVGIGAAADYLAGRRPRCGARARGRAGRPTCSRRSARSRASRSTARATPSRAGGAVSFSLPDLHPHDIAQLVDREGVCVRAGHHCAKPLMRVLGVGATARASAYLYNSHDEIDVLVRALGAARATFG